MQYFEVAKLYDAVPAWVAAALGLGYRWRSEDSRPRRIGLLSMPYESEAAGLIALGALRSDLERTATSHVDTHFDLLLRVCRERTAARLHHEISSDVPKWDVRNAFDDTLWRFVDYDSELDVIVLELAKHRAVVKHRGKRIPNPHGACSRYIMRDKATDWQLDDCASPQLLADGNALEHSDYIDLPSCVGPILDENLHRSYDGLVLVGQGAARDSNYMQKFYAAGFASGDRLRPLGDLLTLHHSERKYIRRLRFLNERAHQDDPAHAAWLVVADGIPALLCAERVFPASDIIGVCNRDAPVVAILQLKEWLNNMIRYYADLDSNHCLSGGMPAGMLLRILERRS